MICVWIVAVRVVVITITGVVASDDREESILRLWLKRMEFNIIIATSLPVYVSEPFPCLCTCKVTVPPLAVLLTSPFLSVLHPFTLLIPLTIFLLYSLFHSLSLLFYVPLYILYLDVGERGVRNP